jgi:hypothetical protein
VFVLASTDGLISLPFEGQSETTDSAGISVLSLRFQLATYTKRHPSARTNSIADIPQPMRRIFIAHWRLGPWASLLPEIDSVEDVKKAADAAFYPPKGDRDICPAVRAAHSNDKNFVDYTTWNNSEILLVPMIENPTRFADLVTSLRHDLDLLHLRALGELVDTHALGPAQRLPSTGETRTSPLVTPVVVLGGKL